MKERVIPEAIATFGASIAFCIFISVRGGVPFSNIIIYGIGCLLYVVIWFALCLFFHKYIEMQGSHEKFVIWLQKSIPLCFLLWLCLNFLTETIGDYAVQASRVFRHNTNWRIYLPLLLIVFGMVLYLLRELKSDSKGFRFLFSAFWTLVSGARFYDYNILLDTHGSIWHSHAYMNSILNAVQGIPYSLEVNSIYGHYGLMYAVPMKILHRMGLNYLQALCLVNVITAVIVFACFFLCLHYFVRSDVLFVVLSIASFEFYYAICDRGVYLQGHPLRNVFPLLLLTVILYVRNKKMRSVCLFLISAASVLWNTETGIVCVLAAALFQILEYTDELEGNFRMKAVLFAAVQMLQMACEIGIAYGIVNIYNRVNSGRYNTFKEFMYPLFRMGDGEYNITNLELTLPECTYAYVGLTVVCCTVCCIRFYRFLKGRPHSREWNAVTVLAVLILGLQTYYINRAAFGNLYLCYAPYLVLLGVMVVHFSSKSSFSTETGKSVLRKAARNFSFYNGMYIASVLLMTVLFLDGLMGINKGISGIQDTIWKTEEMDAFVAQVQEKVPDEIVAFGEGVPELYAVMGRTTQVYLTDWSDMTNTPWIYAVEAIGTPDSFFAYVDSAKRVFGEEVQGYALAESFEYGGYQFGYYIRE